MHVEVKMFDNAEVEVMEDTDPNHPALQTFLQLTVADRNLGSRHVHAYYKDFHAIVGGEDWLDAEMGVPETPEDIWAHVTPVMIALQQDHYGDKRWYVVMEANCAWEEEHGLMLVWRDGAVLTKVGGYDGHVTNANAYDDDKLANVVYSASDPDLTTFMTSE